MDNIQSRADYYMRNETCSSVESVNSSVFYSKFDELVFEFYEFNKNSFLHTVTLPADALKMINPQLSSIQMAVDIVISTLQLGRRRKRALDPNVLYSKRYRHVFFAPTIGNVDFKLEPLISLSNLNSFEALEVRVRTVGIELGVFFPGSISMSLEYGTCPTRGGPTPSQPGGDFRRKRQTDEITCGVLYTELLNIDREAQQMTCGIDDDRRFHAFQLCLGEANAGEIIFLS